MQRPIKNTLNAIALTLAAALPLGALAETGELRIPLGAGGFGFLPLHMMKTHRLIEKQAEKEGQKLTVNWANIGGPSVMIDALLSGSAAISSMPMHLNTRAAHLKSIDDLKPGDKIAVTSVKSSIPSIIMQMHAVKTYGKAEAFRFDPFTVTMKHGDAAAALLSGNANITAHYASAPLDQRERREPAIRSIMNSDDVMGGSTTFTMMSTTTRFVTENPKVYAAVVRALKEAQEMIKSDKRGAAQVLLESMGGSGAGSLEDMMTILDDPSTKYTSQPENVLKYAHFMNDIGSLKNRAGSIQELFHPGGDVASGN
jgi:NitT/TauT family transport system substrate-binding protein